MTFKPLLALVLLGSSITGAIVPVRALAAGGISGGGGNVLPGKAPETLQDPEQVEDEVRESHAIAIDYLSRKISGQTDVQSIAILELARRVPPHITDDRPCFDSAGNVVDGSNATGRHRGRICISALNLARKVHPTELRAQAAALMIHEYAELAGSDEDQAVQLQTGAFKELMR